MRSPVCSIALVLLFAAPLKAHDPGLSTTQLEIRADALVATLGFAPSDVRMLLPQAGRSPSRSWTSSDLGAAARYLKELAPGLLEVRAGPGALAWTEVSVSLASGNSVLFRLKCARPPATRLALHSTVMGRLPPGHRDFVSVTDERGNTLLEKLVGANDADAIVNLPARAAAAAATGDPATGQTPGFAGFLRLGVAHIWTGYDHLLFLFGLLAVCRSFRSIVAIISCFTVAHSITLALATLDVVNLPSRFVEPMIAASISYVGIENLLRRGAEPVGRWALTFAFGLIHGFGFASVLKELGVGSNGHGLAVPLLSFNIGVEIGQITIAAIVLPIVWQLRKNPAFIRRGIPVLSGLVAAAGLYWFLERTIA
ncbi:MAG: HupE/UreJ family protein [Opitutaceae bacterium]